MARSGYARKHVVEGSKAKIPNPNGDNWYHFDMYDPKEGEMTLCVNKGQKRKFEANKKRLRQVSSLSSILRGKVGKAFIQQASDYHGSFNKFASKLLSANKIER
ncbi:hypothetical protein [Candidatus Nanohalococcus occultus]|uniref:hypothetical protein n=1 Tax=Candidatus Nanohalococcus occultus TaxID=2978047 RepID=UPI0039DF9542